MTDKAYTVTLTLPDGRRKYFRGSTRKEAERKRDEAKLKLAMGVNIGDNTTVKELAAIWLRDYKKDEVRESSYLNIERVLNCHVLPELGKMKVRDVKPAHIKHLMNSKSSLAKNTQRIILNHIKALFNLAVENEMILRNPCVKSIHATGEEQKESIPLTPGQSQELLDKSKGSRIRLFVLLGLYAGLRRGELLGLQWQDIDFTQGTVSVRRSVTPTKANPNGELCATLKTDAAERTIPLPWSVIDELRAAKAASKSVYVVHGPSGGHFTFSLLTYHWNKLMKGLPFEAHPHLMRHTRITRWFEQGLDLKEIQYLAGHASLDMTLGIYTHYQAELRMKDTAEKIRATS
jgi:integrase